MKLIRAFLMSFAMFCAIPCPIRFWDTESRHLVTATLPFVGAIIGGLWAGLAYAFYVFDLPSLLVAALLAIYPWVISGFMHLDGFMDTCDAILSRRDLAERQRIIKDPLTGAFAVICLVIIALLSFAAFCEAELSNYIALLAVPIATRSCSALAVQLLRPMGHSQYAKCGKTSFSVILPAITLVASLVLAFVLGTSAFVVVCVAVIFWGIACWQGFRQLDGMSGDISGYAIVWAETFAVIAFAFI